MSQLPTIATYMTPNPSTIGREQSLAQAHKIMRDRSIRHLPVLHGGELVGMVSLGDLDWLESTPNVDAQTMTVEEAMSGVPYVVPASTSLLEVANHMRDHHLGSAIIVEGRNVIGVFTMVDALRALCDALVGSAS